LKKKTIDLFICPNSHQRNFEIFATKIIRRNELLNNLLNDEIENDDEIINGLLINEASNTAYPIIDSIAVLLADEDINIKNFKRLLEPLKDKCPEEFRIIVEQTMHRITDIKTIPEGKWNKDEMKYYDKAVDTTESRKNMIHDIKNRPIWRLFLPRKKTFNQIS